MAGNHDDKPQPKAALAETNAPNALATLDAALADPEMLVEALRYLQQRIPGFVVLPVRERRSMGNAAHLDLKFVEIGIQAANAWREYEKVLGRTAAELSQELDEIRRWDEVERHLRALAKGVADANLRRKHRLGNAILTLYALLRPLCADDAGSYLRPFYEEMKAIYVRSRNPSRAAAKEGADEEGE